MTLEGKYFFYNDAAIPFKKEIAMKRFSRWISASLTFAMLFTSVAPLNAHQGYYEGHGYTQDNYQGNYQGYDSCNDPCYAGCGYDSSCFSCCRPLIGIGAVVVAAIVLAATTRGHGGHGGSKRCGRGGCSDSNSGIVAH